MMKSFFKKLAFVMALAMVVTTAAPAATAFAADAKGIALQTAKSDAEILTSDNIAVGETVDYKFYGAPANWKTMGLKWTSSNEAVATVAQDGKVTGVAAGTATIDLKSTDGSYAVSLAVTVGKVAETYTYKQASHKVATFIFNQDVKYTAEDVTLTKIYGDFEVAWPIESFSCEKNVVAIAPYVSFQDGDVYKVKIGAEDAGTTFTTTLGAVDFVEVTYSTPELGDMGDGKAYTGGEDGTELTVQLAVKLYSNGVDVTKAPGYSTEDVVYTLAEDNEFAMIDEYAGTLVFSKENVGVVVNATYVYYDENDEEQKVTAPTPIVSELVPAYEITGLKEWTIISSTSDEINWKKPVHKVAADENANYQIVALLTDNYGGLISTVDGLDHGDDADDITDFSNSRLDAEGYYVEYMTSNVEKLIVDEEGGFTAFVKASVPVLVSLYDDENELVRTLYAATVAVDNEKKFDKVSIDTTSLTLVTDGEYTDGSVTLRVYDQYGNEWKSSDSSKNVDLEVDCSVEGVTGLPSFKTSFNRKYEITFDGAKIDSPKSTFTLTFTVEDSKSVSVKITLKDPKYNENGTIKVTSYSLYAKDANQTVEDLEEYNDDFGGKIQNKIRYYELSNGYEVGCVSTINGAALTLATKDEDLKLTTSDAIKGQQFIVVYGPDNKIVSHVNDNEYGLGVTGSDGKYNVVVADDVNGEMKYMKTGTYTVKVLQVSSFNKKDEAVFSTKYTKTFKVTNSNKDVKFYKQSALTTDKTDINDIVADTIVLSLGGSKWSDFASWMIADVDYVDNKKAGYIVIKKIKVNVPLNGEDDSVSYVVKDIEINKAVAVPAGFWAE